jgi:Zn finger protein HypA/HybF involved in hydrogenase expression
MTDKIIDFEANLPHNLSEVICVKCLHRHMCVRPSNVLLKDLECPNCSEKGYVIETGQELQEK